MIVANVRVLGSRPTGTQRYTSELLRLLSRRVEKLSPKRKLDGAKGHLWEQLVLPARAGRRLLWSPSNTGPVFLARQVVTIHDVAALDHPEWFSRRFAAWYRWLIPKLARRAQRIIAVSRFTKERIIEVTGVKPEKVAVVPNGVDSRFNPRSEGEIRQARQAIGIPSDRYVLSLGTLEPRKNLRTLLLAWEKLQKTLSENLWLVVAGMKGKTRIFEEASLGDISPRVLLTGHVEDEHLPALYSGAIAFVYPSLYEGFGLPPLEAMACGVPVVAANQTALPEVVGRAGIMVDPYDPDAIADGVRQIVAKEGLREDLIRCGQQRARQFTWARTAEMTWRVLREADQDS